MLCPHCHKEKALFDNELGVLPGIKCQKENDKIPKPRQSTSYDFASPSTKQQRKEHGDEMLQPYIGDVLSREYLEVNGTRGLANVSKQDIKNAKYAYKGMTRHHRMMQNGIMKSQKRYKEPPKDKYTVKEMPDIPD